MNGDEITGNSGTERVAGVTDDSEEGLHHFPARVTESLRRFAA